MYCTMLFLRILLTIEIWTSYDPSIKVWTIFLLFYVTVQIFNILKGVSAPGVQLHTGQTGTTMVPDKVPVEHESVAEEREESGMDVVNDVDESRYAGSSVCVIYHFSLNITIFQLKIQVITLFNLWYVFVMLVYFMLI